MKALEKDPAQRFQTAREPARDLRLLAGAPCRSNCGPRRCRRSGGCAREPSLPRRPRIRRTFTPVASLADWRPRLLAAARPAYVWIDPAGRTHPRRDRAGRQSHGRSGPRSLSPGADASLDRRDSASRPTSASSRISRLVEMIRPFLAASGDMSSNDAIHAIATESGAPFLVVPTLVYRDRDAKLARRDPDSQRGDRHRRSRVTRPRRSPRRSRNRRHSGWSRPRPTASSSISRSTAPAVRSSSGPLRAASASRMRRVRSKKG